MNNGNGDPVVAELNIKLHASGQFYVSAPYTQRGVCYMLLELGRNRVDKECDRIEAEMKKSGIRSASQSELANFGRG